MALLTYISVFSGAGGLDLTVRLAMPDARCVCHVEIEAAAAAILASRMEEGSMDAAPIWSDARTFDGLPWRGRVGGVIAGFPCPDYSLAGRRAGISGNHGQLWYDLARIIREVEPDWVFLENVPGILNPHKIKRWRCIGRDLFDRTIWSQYYVPAGIGFVLGDLAEMGLDAEWGCVSAAQVGASHKRERWWAVAKSESGGFGVVRESSGRDGLTVGLGDAVADSGGGFVSVAGRSAASEAVGNTECPRWATTGSGSGLDAGAQSEPRCGDMGDTFGEGLEVGRSERSDDGSEFAAAERAGLPLFAPGPSDPRWADLLVLYPWLRPSLAQAETESAFRGMADGMAGVVADTRADALRAAGNGAVAIAGAVALRELLRRIR